MIDSESARARERCAPFCYDMRETFEPFSYALMFWRRKILYFEPPGRCCCRVTMLFDMRRARATVPLSLRAPRATSAYERLRAATARGYAGDTL